MKRQIINILLIIIMLLTITGCKKKEQQSSNEQTGNQTTETYNLNIIYLNGKKKDQIAYPKGTEITKPEDPTKKGYMFGGWYYDITYETKVTFPFTLNKDTVIYAAWYSEIYFKYEEETDSYAVSGASLYIEEAIIPSEYEGKPVTKICENVFESRNELVKVVLPDTITEIEDGAFNYCSKLTTINLPDSIKKLGNGIFNGCDKIEYENVNGLKYLNNWLVDAKNVVMDRTAFKESTIGIFPNAFKENNNISEIRIPTNVKVIYEGTFKESSITKLIIGTNLEYIDLDALRDTLFLEKIEVASDNKNYTSVNGVLYDKNITKLLHYPTERNNSEYVMPNTVVEVESFACMNNNYLTNLKLSENLIVVNSYAFFKCPKLTNITFGSKLETIKDEAFNYNGSLKEINLPSSIKEIGKNVFEYAQKVEKVSIPFVSNNEINYSVSYLFGSVDKIPTLLYKVEILGGDTIKENSLEGLSNVTELVIPSTIKNIESGAFSHCIKLTKLVLNENEYYKIVNNTLYTKNGETLVYYLHNSKNTTFQPLPTTKTIVKHAFSNAHTLESIILNDGLLKIEEQAFYEMNNLTKLVIPESVVITEQDICFLTPNVVIYSKLPYRADGWSEGWNTLNYPVKWNSYFPKFENLELERYLAINETYLITYELKDAPKDAKVVLEALDEGIVSIDGLNVTGIGDGIVQLKLYVEGYETEHAIIIIYVGNIE